MKHKKISVALCTYNGSAHIKEQFESILNQSLHVDEIIICDDRSTDNTIELINEFKSTVNTDIRLLINDRTLKVQRNFEKAIRHCTGDLIFLSDQDDIWDKEKVKKISAYFFENPKKNVVFTNARLLVNNEIATDTSWLKNDFTTIEKARLSDPLKMLAFLLLKKNIATGATMALRKKIIPHYLPLPVFKNYLHDYLLVLISAAENSLGFIDECLITYRIHDAQQIGFRKRSVPFYLWPAYRLLQILKKMVLRKKRLNKKRMVAAYLKKYAAYFPEGLKFLESI